MFLVSQRSAYYVLVVVAVAGDLALILFFLG